MRRHLLALIGVALAIALGAIAPFLGSSSPTPFGNAWAAAIATAQPPAATGAIAGTEPPYPHGKFRADCAMCHRPDAWTPARIGKQFDHERYGFALRGAHLAVPCRQCHASLDFASASTACSDCHADVHQGELGSDCSRCHGTRSFIDRGDQVRMHRLTRFPLSGAHSTVDCESCHALQAGGALTYVKTPTECEACHMKDFTAAKNPDHIAGAFSRECSTCHTDVTWSRTNFDHAASGFPLTGAHATATCTACHTGGSYAGLSTQCVSCHQADYNGTTNPAHQAAGFPTTCQECHGTGGWDGAHFDHAMTGFVLTGAHASAQCLDCHVGGSFTGTSPLCVSCHQSDYNGTTNPAHQASGFPTTCQDCHGTAGWDGAQFNHASTGFALTGAHTNAQCLDCHVGGNFTNTSPLCVSCHQTDFNSTTNPAHQAAGFPTTCQDCHTTITWTGARFDHDAQWFPIYSGRHNGRWDQCSDCHTVVNTFSSFNCLNCHPHSDKAQTDSNHRGQNGYRYDSAACYDCHPRGNAG